MTLLQELIRIALRIFGSFLLGAGYVAEDQVWIFTDPELVGALTLIVSESWFTFAKWQARRK